MDNHTLKKEKLTEEVCLGCGELFLRSSFHPSKIYCNEKCGEIYNRFKRNKLKNIEITKLKKCHKCKELFIWSSKVPSKKFCSDKCGRHYKKIITENRKCKNCKELFLWESSCPKRMFCNNDCCNEWHKNNKKTTGSIRLRFEIFKRDNFTCQYCGRNVKDDKIKIRCDHIFPVAKGGKTIEGNLITSCEECNIGKSDILLNNSKLKEIDICSKK